jgi:hypothetical protein
MQSKWMCAQWVMPVLAVAGLEDFNRPKFRLRVTNAESAVSRNQSFVFSACEIPDAVGPFTPVQQIMLS